MGTALETMNSHCETDDIELVAIPCPHLLFVYGTQTEDEAKSR